MLTSELNFDLNLHIELQSSMRLFVENSPNSTLKKRAVNVQL